MIKKVRHPFSVRFDAELSERLDRVCKRLDKPKISVVRDGTRHELDKLEKEIGLEGQKDE